MHRLAWGSALMLLALAVPALTGAASDNPRVAIGIKNHEFVPSEVTIPSGTKVELIVTNHDRMPAEFESLELHREKVVTGGQTVSIFVGPLDPGRYGFFDDFHPQTRGHLVAK